MPTALSSVHLADLTLSGGATRDGAGLHFTVNGADGSLPSVAFRTGLVVLDYGAATLATNGSGNGVWFRIGARTAGAHYEEVSVQSDGHVYLLAEGSQYGAGTIPTSTRYVRYHWDGTQRAIIVESSADGTTYTTMDWGGVPTQWSATYDALLDDAEFHLYTPFGGPTPGLVVAMSGSASLTWPTIASVVIAPPNATASVGTTITYTGTATLSDSSTRPVTSGDGQFGCSIGVFGGTFGVWTAPAAPATGTTTFIVPANSNTGQTLVTATTPVTVVGARIGNTAVGGVARTLVTMGRRDLRARFSERPVVRALLGPLNNATIPVPPTPPASGRVLARSVTD